MKYAFMSFSCPELSLADMLALAGEIGYDAIEPRVSSGHAHGLELDCSRKTRKAAAALAADTGIDICCVATSCRFADAALTEQMIADAKAAIDLAADINCCRIRVFGGAIGRELSRQQAIDLVADSLGSLGDYAADRNVTVCMETHDSWCNPEHVAAVMQKCSHKSVAVNWDIMHPVRFENWDMTAAFELLRPWVRHVHFHDGGMEGENYVLKPIGTGQVDHRTAIKLVGEAGLDVYFSGEWIAWQRDYREYLTEELATMKSYE